MVGVLTDLFLGPLFSAAATVELLIVIKVVVFVFVEVAFRHGFERSNVKTRD